MTKGGVQKKEGWGKKIRVPTSMVPKLVVPENWLPSRIVFFLMTWFISRYRQKLHHLRVNRDYDPVDDLNIRNARILGSSTV